MVTGVFLWLSMVLHGYLLSVVICGYSWLYMVIHVFVVIFGYSGLFVVTRGYLWLYVVIRGYTWLIVVIHGYLWLFVFFCGYSLLLMVIHGYSWLLVVIHVLGLRFLYKYLDIKSNESKFLILIEKYFLLLYNRLPELFGLLNY